MYWSPDSLQSRGKNVANLDPEFLGTYTVFEKENRDRDLSYNVYAGRPIVKNKLFIFALAEGRDDKTDRFQQNKSIGTRSHHPNGMVKIDFTPNDQHRFEFTGITNKKETDTSTTSRPPVPNSRPATSARRKPAPSLQAATP